MTIQSMRRRRAAFRDRMAGYRARCRPSRMTKWFEGRIADALAGELGGPSGYAVSVDSVIDALKGVYPPDWEVVAVEGSEKDRSIKVSVSAPVDPWIQVNLKVAL